MKVAGAPSLPTSPERPFRASGSVRSVHGGKIAWPPCPRGRRSDRTSLAADAIWIDGLEIPCCRGFRQDHASYSPRERASVAASSSSLYRCMEGSNEGSSSLVRRTSPAWPESYQDKLSPTCQRAGDQAHRENSPGGSEPIRFPHDRHDHPESGKPNEPMPWVTIPWIPKPSRRFRYPAVIRHRGKPESLSGPGSSGPGPGAGTRGEIRRGQAPREGLCRSLSWFHHSADRSRRAPDHPCGPQACRP